MTPLLAVDSLTKPAQTVILWHKLAQTNDISLLNFFSDGAPASRRSVRIVNYYATPSTRARGVPYCTQLQPCSSLSSPGRLHVILFKSLAQICCVAKIPKQHDTYSVWLYKNEDLSYAHTIGHKLEFSHLVSGQAICLALTKPLISSWLLWFCERFPNLCFWWSNSEVTFLYWVQQGKQSL